MDTFVIVHALLDGIDGCARHPDKVCDLSISVPHEERQKLSLDCLSVKPF